MAAIRPSSCAQLIPVGLEPDNLLRSHSIGRVRGRIIQTSLFGNPFLENDQLRKGCSIWFSPNVFSFSTPRIGHSLCLAIELYVLPLIEFPPPFASYAICCLIGDERWTKAHKIMLIAFPAIHFIYFRELSKGGGTKKKLGHVDEFEFKCR